MGNSTGVVSSSPWSIVGVTAWVGTPQGVPGSGDVLEFNVANKTVMAHFKTAKRLDSVLLTVAELAPLTAEPSVLEVREGVGCRHSGPRPPTCSEAR